MSDWLTLLEVGGPLAALGGGAAYTRARHSGVYWSTVGLPISTAGLLGSYSSVMDACGLTVQPSRLRPWRSRRQLGAKSGRYPRAGASSGPPQRA